MSKEIRQAVARLCPRAKWVLTVLLLTSAWGCTGQSPAEGRPKWALAVHGGTGVVERASMTPAMEADYRAGLSRALESGANVLRDGGTALDSVESVVRILEDDPLFNAGRGAVFTSAGRNELDASIMDGASLRAGAVTGVTRTRHPISLARAVMDKSPHVMLSGEGADAFAETQELEVVEPSFFFTEPRWLELEKALKDRGEVMPERPRGVPKPQGATGLDLRIDKGLGTVGAVALDSNGNIAAATSTGGTNAKRWGRIGDSPIIGAGTYASNQSCAASGTGIGEFFIRLTLAREVCALVQYSGVPLQQAAEELIQNRLSSLTGSGGVIVVSPKGEIAWSFNTEGMYRGRVSSTSSPQIAIYKSEPADR